MSCDTLNNQTVRFNVSFGALPEGFCPATMQELGNAIVARIIVTPNTSFTSFAIGPNAPTTNVGPWLKDCLQWFFFDDATATYIPQAKGGFDAMSYYTASNTFVVPDNIYKIKIHAWGGGGGAADNGGAGATSSGGGGGSFGMAIVAVTPAQAINFTIGSGGAAGTPSGTAGGSTIILAMTAGGGAPGVNTVTPAGGAGGTAIGFTVNMRGGAGQSSVSNASASGGAGGDSPQGGAGGSMRENQAGIVPGGGGGGCVASTGSGGAGAGGAVLIEY